MRAAGRVALAGSSRPVLPTIANLALHLDASQIVGQADNTPLSSWPDLSGGSHNFSASGVSRPTYYSSTVGKLINRLPAVWFGGLSFNEQMTTTAAAQFVSASDGSCSIFAVAASDGSTNVQGILTDGINEGTGPAFQLRFATDVLGVVQDSAGTSHVATIGSSAPSAPCIAATIWTPTSIVTRLNRVAGSTTSFSATLTTIAINLTLGNIYNGSGFPLNGPIAEVLVYSRAVTGAEITQIETYLHNKWGTP